MTHSIFSHCGNPRVQVDLKDEDLSITAYPVGADQHRVVDIRWGSATLNMRGTAAAALHAQLGSVLSTPPAASPHIRTVPAHNEIRSSTT